MMSVGIIMHLPQNTSFAGITFAVNNSRDTSVRCLCPCLRPAPLADLAADAGVERDEESEGDDARHHRDRPHGRDRVGRVLPQAEEGRRTVRRPKQGSWI